MLRNAAVGGGSVLLSMMEQLAREAGRPELTGAPFVFWGWSASAAFGTTFAQDLPDRTAAVIRYHTHLREQRADIEALARTPLLLIAGAKDETAGTENAESLWKAGLERGAPWTLVIEPEAAHLDEKALLSTQRLIFPWLAAVLERRVAVDGTLRPLTDERGWSGNRTTGAIAPRAASSRGSTEVTWLPDEPSALAWQRVSNRQP